MSNEQDEALAALAYIDNSKILNDAATRANIESQTNVNNAVIALALERTKLRTTFRRCAVFVCVLATSWSVFLFIR